MATRCQITFARCCSNSWTTSVRKRPDLQLLIAATRLSQQTAQPASVLFLCVLLLWCLDRWASSECGKSGADRASRGQRVPGVLTLHAPDRGGIRWARHRDSRHHLHWQDRGARRESFSDSSTRAHPAILLALAGLSKSPFKLLALRKGQNLKLNDGNFRRLPMHSLRRCPSCRSLSSSLAWLPS